MTATSSQNIVDNEEEIPELEDNAPGHATPASRISTNTEQAGLMGQLNMVSPYHPGAPDPKDLKVQVTTSSAGEVRKVRQVTPLPPKFDQAPERFNITQLVSQVSREVTQSVVSHLTGLDPAETQEDLYIREALAASRKEPAATITKPDNIPAILRAMRTGGSGDQTRTRAIPAACGQPVAAVRPQPEPELPPRGRPGRWNPDPLGLQADITAQQQQKDRGRERRTGSAKRRSGSRPRDDVKRGRQTPSSDEASEPAIDWGNNKIGPRTPKSPARTSRISAHLRGNSRPASRHTQTRPITQKEKVSELTKEEKALEAKKKRDEDIILNYPGTFISARIGEMLAERFMAEAQSLRFYGALAMTRTKEIIALADWGYQYSLVRASPLPDIPVFLQQSCCGSRNAAHEVPAAPIRIMLETADIRKRSRMLWTHLCCLLQFWTDEAAYSEGNAFYGGYAREESCLVHYVMMRMNSRGRGEKVITWRDIVIGTPWLQERKDFSAAQEAAFRLQPPPAGPNELEKEMEAWWQVEVLRKKCAVRSSSATSSALPPDAPPNTPASSVADSTLPGPINNPPATTSSRPPPGLPPPASNQFIPGSDWTKLPNPRDNPAPSGQYRTPFDELDVELGRSSLVETPLSQLETQDAVDGLLDQYPDLSGGPAQDVEMMDLPSNQAPDMNQPLNTSPVKFRPEIGDPSGYNYNLVDQESGMSTTPGSPVTVEDNELLDSVSMVSSPAADYSRAVGTGRPKSTTPRKKQFKGSEDPSDK